MTNTKEKKRWNTRQEIYRMNRFPSKMIEGLLEAKK